MMAGSGHAGVFDLELCEHDEKGDRLSDSDDMDPYPDGAEVSRVSPSARRAQSRVASLP